MKMIAENEILYEEEDEVVSLEESDISKHESLKLGKSDLAIHDVFPNTSDYFYMLDGQWRFTYVNNSAAMIFSKIMKQNVVGKYYWDIFPTADDLYFLKFSEAKLKQKHVYFEAFSVLTDGWVRVNVYPSPEGISVYFRDISEQKRYEQSLEDERKRLYAILNGLPGLVYLRTREGRIVFANQTFKSIHGEPNNGNCYSILFNKEEPCSYCHKGIESETIISNQWQCVIKDTIYEVYQHPCEDSDGTQLFLMQLLDITKRKLAEEEIARLDQLNLVGELAASIAHEVRNPMTTVRGFLQILKTRDALHENTDYFDLMISELDRANSILTEFLSIAKTKTKLYATVKLNDLVESLYPLVLADATNQDKQVVLEIEEVAELTLNEREMRQLILNLTRNGLEAMHTKGTLKIKTYQDANSIVLAVQDQGTGIGQEMLGRLGTPFLTTKEEGTGLGLATCYSIAERHNAKIEVESSASGTTFFVRFKLGDES
ncbi:PAS domain-containing sensor histidine kinase [Desulfosporosinus metallidurans]|uniref:histidine kinase n=1 Tax=Desulfosporosinus metallidurans TaxID=1888891 RepID=A0A1Q8QYL0_9FIRM|nr:PAS domain-containing sensor histidine kinase [Desulfosporosinus metallidurans]OLN32448.1 Signal transduction histidine kinase nitrogen specific-like protein [Desulfosporosinus metallidurans]